MNALIIPVLVGIILIVSAFIIFPQWSEADAKTQAQKIIDFRKTDHSCKELKRSYLDFYNKKYNSHNDLTWYWEVRKKLVDECVDSIQLNDIEYLEICKDSHFTSCEISKLETPKQYEDFDFRTAILNLKLKDGSES